MYRLGNAIALLLLVAVGSVLASYPGVGRVATPGELAAWDTDIGPNLNALPVASGSVIQGRHLYEAHCAACHGSDGRSTKVFLPLVGGITTEDVATGRVAGLSPPPAGGGSTLMLLPTLTTLLDYTQRAMPFGAAGTLNVDEVFAISAYVLYLGGVVDEDFVLDNTTAVLAQNRLPNRNGFTNDHGMWPGAPAATGGLGNGGVPDTNMPRCMNHCEP